MDSVMKGLMGQCIVPPRIFGLELPLQIWIITVSESNKIHICSLEKTQRKTRKHPESLNLCQGLTFTSQTLNVCAILKSASSLKR